MALRRVTAEFLRVVTPSMGEKEEEQVAELPTTRAVVTDLPGPRSTELLARRNSAVSGGVGKGFPVFIERGHGAILVDIDGNQLLDLGSGIAVTSIGHGVKEVTDAISAQAANLLHTCFMVTPYEGYVAVAEALNELCPVAGPAKTVLLNSGAEAVENAVKIARSVTGRQAIAVFDHAYHGRTNLTMALTAKSMPYKHRFGPFAPEVYRAPMSYPYRDGLSGEEAAKRAISVLESQIGASNLAAVLIEPVQGEGGFIVPAKGFLPAIATWCTQNSVLFIADEIQSGFCRTGNWFALDDEGVKVDLVTTAKGIAGGMPLAAVTGRAEIMDAIHEGGLGGTYGGNPVACAAALAAISVMRRDDLAGRARTIGKAMTSILRTLSEDLPRIGEVRGRGAMVAIELVTGQDKTPDAPAAKAVANLCNQAGVIVLTCGTYGNVIRLLPPLVITDEQLHDGLTVLAGALREVLA